MKQTKILLLAVILAAFSIPAEAQFSFNTLQLGSPPITLEGPSSGGGTLQFPAGDGILLMVPQGSPLDLPNGVTVENGLSNPYAASITTTGEGGLQITCTAQKGINLDDNTNFITFFDGAGKNRGGIQGQSFSDWAFSGIALQNLDIFIGQSVLAVATLIGAAAQAVMAGATAGATAVEFVAFWCIPSAPDGIISFINRGLALAMLTFQALGDILGLEAYTLNTLEYAASLGVQYGSASGDYAEYLKRENAYDKFQPGDIVGVRNGMITKNTDSAQNVFAISTAPIVLGNEPAKGEEADYDKVGFLGQVPVKVRGIVHAGDFIAASGLNDGWGVAIAPEKITPKQFTTVLGRAWEAGQNTWFNIVKVAIGLSGKDMSEIASREQEEIDALKLQTAMENASMASMDQRFQKLATAIAEPDAAKRQSLLAQSLQTMEPLKRNIPNPGQLWLAGGAQQSGALPLRMNIGAPNPGDTSGILPKTPATKINVAAELDSIKRLTDDAVVKMLAAGPPPAATYDKITQLPSFLSLKHKLVANIQKIVAGEGTAQTKAALIKTCLTAPDAETRNAFATCALAVMPVMNSMVSATSMPAVPTHGPKIQE